MKNEIKEIQIDKIQVGENSRTTMDVSELMKSINQEGMHQPIGIYPIGNNYQILYGNRRLIACKKLGYIKIEARIYPSDTVTEDALVINLIENIQRKDINIVEVGRIATILKGKSGLSTSEIASRLSKPISYVNNALQIYSKVPAKFKSKIEVMGKGRLTKRGGKIPATLAVKILNIQKGIGLNRLQVEGLFEYCKTNELGNDNLVSVARWLKQGTTLKEALKKLKSYQFTTLKVAISRAQVKKLITKYDGALASILLDMLKGNIKERLVG